MNKNKKKAYEYLRLMKNNQYKKRDLHVIGAFSALFHGEHKVFVRNRLLDTFDKIHWNQVFLENRPYRVSLWEKKKDGQEYIRFIALEADASMKFCVEPTYKLSFTKKRVQYIWTLTEYVKREEFCILKQITDALCYLSPGAKSLIRADDIQVIIPGIPNKISGIPGRFEKVGKIYPLNELKNLVESYFPVKGKSLHAYLRSESIYEPGLSTFKQFLALKRVNILFNIKWTKHEFHEKRHKLLFLMQNFLFDLGKTIEEAERYLWNWVKRRGYTLSDKMLYYSRPVRSYKFKNETIVKMLGEPVKKYFPYYQKKIDADGIRKKIAELAKDGKKICEIAAVLGVSISLIKRRRSEAVKLGLLGNSREH